MKHSETKIYSKSVLCFEKRGLILMWFKVLQMYCQILLYSMEKYVQEPLEVYIQQNRALIDTMPISAVCKVSTTSSVRLITLVMRFRRICKIV